MSIKDRIKQEAQEGGFRPHPIGTFPGEVVDVIEREWEGRIIFEIQCRTARGKAKTSIWKTTYDDIDSLIDGVRNKTREDAEDSYVKTIGRLCRLYKDLGLEEPDGDDHVAIEEDAYGRLGELIGQQCTIVVQENKTKPENPFVYINAPREEAEGAHRRAPAKAAATRGGKPAGKPASRQTRRAPADDQIPPPDDSDVPF